MRRLLPAFLIVVFTCVQACKHKLPEPVKPQPADTTKTPPVTPPPPQNPKDSVCFAQEIQPLLVSNCAKSGCHDNVTASQGIVLSDFTSVKSSVSGSLLMQVIQDPGPLGMPPAPHQKLTFPQVSQIQKWVNEGMRDGIDCQAACDTSNFTFSGAVMPILSANCVGCHQSQAPIFSNYDGVKPLAQNGKLMCVINHAPGCHPMPKGGQKLSPCKIRLIAKWVEAGAPNN